MKIAFSICLVVLVVTVTVLLLTSKDGPDPLKVETTLPVPAKHFPESNDQVAGSMLDKSPGEYALDANAQ